MPEIGQIPEPKHVNLEDQPFRDLGQIVQSSEAVQRVVETFNRYEQARQQKHDSRWLDNDNLYIGYVQKRKWPGTDQDRSSLGIPIAFDQIQAAHPAIVSELFSNTPYWFGVESTTQSQPQEAASIQAALSFQLDVPFDASGLSTRTQLKLAIMELLQHGSCALELQWDAPKQRLVWEQVLLRDLYIDPDLTSPIIDRSSAVIRRQLVTVKDLRKLRDDPRFNVPSDPVLFALVTSVPHSTSDQMRSQQEAIAGRGGNWAPNINQPEPENRSVEILKYWTPDKTIWVINRKWLLLNDNNPFGFLPYVFTSLYWVIGEAYGMSVPDAVEGDQKLIQGLVNARIDELSLAIHKPRVVSSADHRKHRQWGPGVEIQARNPELMQFLDTGNVTADAFREVALAEQRVEKRTGITSLFQTGTPPPSNINRSATGARAQVGGATNRLRTIIENIEDFLIVPMLYKSHATLQRFLPQEQPATAGIDPEGQATSVERGLVNGQARFIMTASSRMQSRERLQSIFQPLLQVYMNEGFIKQLAQTGETVDMQEVNRFVRDAMGTATTYQFTRQLTPEEQEAINQPPPEVTAKLQEAEMNAQTRVQMGELKAQTEQQKTQTQAQGKQEEVAEKSAAEIVKALMQFLAKQGDKERREE